MKLQSHEMTTIEMAWFLPFSLPMNEDRSLLSSRILAKPVILSHVRTNIIERRMIAHLVTKEIYAEVDGHARVLMRMKVK